MPINYELAKKQGPKLKAALTRAENTFGNSLERYTAVLKACRKAVKVWEQWGAWPDEWSRWQRALDDAFYAAYRDGFFNDAITSSKRLEEL